jgi:hypothetical protein
MVDIGAILRRTMIKIWVCDQQEVEPTHGGRLTRLALPCLA